MRIAVDAMGGDHAPRSIIDGALAAARHLDLGLVLTGPSGIVRAELARHPDACRLDIQVVDAPDVVGMEDHQLGVGRIHGVTPGIDKRLSK